MINVIRKFRKDKKMSQKILANKCKVSRQTINAIENNKYDPSLDLAFKIATILNVTVDELFQFQLEENKSKEETE
ncbi:helix-turn-helix transcriptional regulator [Virgibacillus sp. JSM 102003]|uniref:helix-turn-helix transcriptional regulator n=1 Tax=Virgibacillus sp. JSM 102003 TaxID=1562108 RepID=UPI0035BFDA17